MLKLSFTVDHGASWPSSVGAAKRAGFDGVFLRTNNEPRALALGAAAIGRALTDAGLAAGGVRNALAWTGNATRDTAMAEAVRQWIDFAAACSCPTLGPIVAGAGAGRATSMATLAPFRDWLLPLGTYAHALGVKLLLGDEGMFRSARNLWTILDQLPRDQFGCEWHLPQQGDAGEAPSVVIPTLNLRLGLVGCTFSQPTAPAAESMRRLAENTVHRLAGIGYAGWFDLAIAGDHASSEVSLAEPALAMAVGDVRRWLMAKPAHAATGAKKAPAAAAGAH